MVRIAFVWMGKARDDPVDLLVRRYLQRMRRWIGVEEIRVKTGPYPAGSSLTSALARDAERLRRVWAKWPRRVLFDPAGSSWSTAVWLRWWEDCVADGRSVAMVVGGPHGVHESLRREATWVVSLGPIVLSHGLVRVVVAEHTYRVLSMWKGAPFAK